MKRQYPTNLMDKEIRLLLWKTEEEKNQNPRKRPTKIKRKCNMKTKHQREH